MTGNHAVNLALLILGPLLLWRWHWASTWRADDAETLILGALCVAPRVTLTEAQLQHLTGLSEQDLTLALDRLHDRVQRSNSRVTLR